MPYLQICHLQPSQGFQCLEAGSHWLPACSLPKALGRDFRKRWIHVENINRKYETLRICCNGEIHLYQTWKLQGLMFHNDMKKLVHLVSYIEVHDFGICLVPGEFRNLAASWTWKSLLHTTSLTTLCAKKSFWNFYPLACRRNLCQNEVAELIFTFPRKAVQTYDFESWNIPCPGNGMEFITFPQYIAEASLDVHLQSLQDNLNETFYTASKAKLHCRFSDTTYGLSLSAGGFSQKLLQLVETMIHGLWLKSLSKDRFHSQWEELCRSYRNAWLKPQAGLRTLDLLKITQFVGKSLKILEQRYKLYGCFQK